jgi:hypothetical protein
MNTNRAHAALSYWCASRRFLLREPRIRMSDETAEIALIEHALDVGWPRLSVAATGTLVVARRRARARAAIAPTCGGRSRSRGPRRRRPKG